MTANVKIARLRNIEISQTLKT